MYTAPAMHEELELQVATCIPLRHKTVCNSDTSGTKLLSWWLKVEESTLFAIMIANKTGAYCFVRLLWINEVQSVSPNWGKVAQSRSSLDACSGCTLPSSPSLRQLSQKACWIQLCMVISMQELAILLKCKEVSAQEPTLCSIKIF